VKKNGTSENGKQRFLCCNEKCPHKTFLEHYTYNAWDPSIRSRIFFSIVNGSGTRATAGTPGIAKDTVTDALRSIEALLWYASYDYLRRCQTGGVTVEIAAANGVETDETGSFVGDKSHQYWLWRATDQNTDGPPTFHFGTREHKNLDELLALLRPFDINIVYSDNNYACRSHITDSEAVTGKENTQKIERNHLSLRTWCSRLVWKGIRFSKELFDEQRVSPTTAVPANGSQPVIPVCGFSLRFQAGGCSL
jgi:insertion element IS1 protein InsB